MRYVVRKSIVQMVGTIWMPSITAASTIEMSGYDVENARDENGEINRESVQRWLDCNAGDFSNVTDFFASIEDGNETLEIPWADEDNEFIYSDCTYGAAAALLAEIPSDHKIAVRLVTRTGGLSSGVYTYRSTTVRCLRWR